MVLNFISKEKKKKKGGVLTTKLPIFYILISRLLCGMDHRAAVKWLPSSNTFSPLYHTSFPVHWNVRCYVWDIFKTVGLEGGRGELNRKGFCVKSKTNYCRNLYVSSMSVSQLMWVGEYNQTSPLLLLAHKIRDDKSNEMGL